MNSEFYYITKDNPTVKVPLEPKHDINLCSKNIIELILPKCKRVWCYQNQLKKLILPEDCELISCSVNELTELIIPKTCKDLDCSDNQLTQLTVPIGCELIDCSNNKLTQLIVPKTCEWICCYANKLHPIIINLLESEDPIKIQLACSLQFKIK
jgi:Leucine-rich repeat (LRR) protein